MDPPGHSPDFGGGVLRAMATGVGGGISVVDQEADEDTEGLTSGQRKREKVYGTPKLRLMVGRRTSHRPSGRFFLRRPQGLRSGNGETQLVPVGEMG